MKIKNYSIILAFLSLLFIGCKDYLQLVPPSTYSLSGGYKTQTDFEQAIAGAYAQQQLIYRSNTSWLYGMITRSDELKLSAQYVYGMDNCTDDASNSQNYAYWNMFWKVIGRCNIILDKINDGTFTDATYQKSITGEAYLLRAYSYWSLASQYGGMPIIDKTLSVDEVKKIARSSTAATFTFAEGDFKKAIDLLPETWTGSNLGRGTKYAAMGMLARMYMFQSNFAAAQPLLATIIASKKYAMEPTYLNCFLDSKDNGPERVWEVQFTGGQLGEGNQFISTFMPDPFNDKTIMPFTGYSSYVIVADSLYHSYEKGDKRRDISVLKGYNNNGTKDTVSLFVLKYTHYDTYTPKDQSDWANNIPILRYTDVVMMNAEALNELGYVAGGEAFSILNSVRARAGLVAYTAADLPDKVAFRNAIIKERRVEFAFEGLRWFDLLRWNLATQMKNLQFAQPINGRGKYKMEDFRKLLPIPFDELTRYNDASIMPQNPGY